MTHFLPAIKALRNSNPKTKREKKAKRRALDILYGIERTERREQPRKKQTSLTVSAFRGGIALARFGHGVTKKGIASHKEKQSQKRFTKARTVRAIQQSNLSPERKQFEISQLTHQPVPKPITPTKPAFEQSLEDKGITKHELE